MPPGKKPVADEVVRARAEGRTYTAEQLIERAGQLEAKVAQLRNRYEQYFLGMERKPPSNDRDSLHKELDTLRQLSTKNTAIKFRLNTLYTRFLSYERLWMRTEREIEEGRYHRDLFKARMHARRNDPDVPPPPSPTSAVGPDEHVDTSDFDDFDEVTEAPARAARPEAPPPPRAPVPAARPAPTAQAPARAAHPSASGVPDEQRLRSVYDAFIMAKRECREPTDGLTFEQVAGKLRAQVPAILKQTNSSAVDFKVVIKDGKATLRAIPKP